jgi:hypothetical protein
MDIAQLECTPGLGLLPSGSWLARPPNFYDAIRKKDST